MLPVSSAMLGPHASRTLSAKGRSFWGAIDGHTTGMIQALWAKGLDTFNDRADTVSDKAEAGVVGLHGFQGDEMAIRCSAHDEGRLAR